MTTALLVVTILTQKEELVTLRQLKELHLLQPEFYDLPTLPASRIAAFISKHPAYKVAVQAVISGKSSGCWGKATEVKTGGAGYE